MKDIRSFIDSTPGIFIASSGLAIMLFISEAGRLSSYQTINVASYASTIAQFIMAVVAVLLICVYTKYKQFHIHRQTSVGVGIAALYAVSSFASADAAIMSLDFVPICVTTVKRTCELLLLVQWMELFVLLGVRTASYVFALAIAEVALINCFTIFIKAEAMGVVLAILPLLSVSCLHWFKAYSASLGEYFGDASFLFAPGKKKPVHHAGFGRKIAVFLFVLPIFFYVLLCGNVHYAWLPAQDGSFVSLFIQGSASLGTLFCALMLLAAFSKGLGWIKHLGFAVFSLLLFAVYLTVVLEGKLSFLYVIPLNMAQKLVLFMIWMSPFVLTACKSVMNPWLICMALYALGKGIASCVANFAPGMYSEIVAVAIIVCILVNVINMFISEVYEVDAKKPAAEHPHTDAASNPSEAACAADADAECESDNEQNAMLLNCEKAAEKYRLTRREEEVLLLLMQGYTAATIAEILVVSVSTAKSHIRNIYAKMDVHTQNELILLVMNL